MHLINIDYIILPVNEDLFNLGAKAIIRNSKGQILVLQTSSGELQNRKDWRGETAYDIPGGRINKGDSIEKTLYREVKEETGMTVKSSCLFTSLISNVRLKNTLVGDIGLVLSVYLVKVQNYNIVLNKENLNYEWLSPTTAAKKLISKYPKNFCYQIAKLI